MEKQIPSFIIRALLAAAVLGCLRCFEVLGNATNSQWFLAIFAAAILGAEAGTTRLAKVLDHIVLILFAFTGPLVIALTPLAFWLKSKTQSAWLLAICGAGAATQATAIFVSPRRQTFQHDLFDIARVIAAPARCVVGDGVFARTPMFSIVAASAVLAFLGWSFWKGPSYLRGVILYGLAALASGIAITGPGVRLISGEMGDRYTFILGVALVSSVVCILLQNKSAGLPITALCIWVALGGWQVEGYPSAPPPTSVGDTLKVPIQPTGWSMELKRMR